MTSLRSSLLVLAAFGVGVPALPANVLYDIFIAGIPGGPTNTLPAFEVNHAFINFLDNSNYTFVLSDFTAGGNPLAPAGESYTTNLTLSLDAAGTTATITTFRVQNGATFYSTLGSPTVLTIPHDSPASVTTTLSSNPGIFFNNGLGCCQDPVQRPLTLTISAVPEPANWGLAAIGVGMLLQSLRRLL